jgi:hypothetical protein
VKKLGRKMKYGEETVPMRIPVSLVPVVENLLKEREVLQGQWEASMLPPAAEKLISRISELLALPGQAIHEQAKDMCLVEYEKEQDPVKKKEILKYIEELDEQPPLQHYVDDTKPIVRRMLLEVLKEN